MDLGLGSFTFLARHGKPDPESFTFISTSAVPESHKDYGCILQYPSPTLSIRPSFQTRLRLDYGSREW